MCLGVLLFGLILYGTLCPSWTWMTVSFSRLGKFSPVISSNMFSAPFYLSSPSGTPILWIFVHLILSQRALKLSSFLFILFPFFCLVAVISTTPSLSLLIHFSVSFSLQLIPSSVFFISVTVFFSSLFSLLYFLSLCLISYWFYFFFSQVQWAFFVTITLNSSSGKLLISISFSNFPGVLSCSLIWKVFLVSSFCITLCVSLSD